MLARVEKRLDETEARHVRLDVYSAQQQTDAVQIRAWEAEMHSLGKRLDRLMESTTAAFRDLDDRRRADRALILTGLVLPLILLLLGAVLLPGGTP